MILPERVFGRPGAHWMKSGVAIGPISLRTHCASSARSASDGDSPADQRDVGVDALALDLVRAADDRGFGDFGVRDQRALDLRRADAVAGDIHDVIHAAGDPPVAVLVAARAVAGEVLAAEVREIGVDESMVVAVDRAHLAGPAVEQHEVALGCAFEDVAMAVDECGPHAGQRQRRGACLQHRRAGQR